MDRVFGEAAHRGCWVSSTSTLLRNSKGAKVGQKGGRALPGQDDSYPQSMQSGQRVVSGSVLAGGEVPSREERTDVGTAAAKGPVDQHCYALTAKPSAHTDMALLG